MKNKKLLATLALVLAFIPTFTACEAALEDVLIGVLTGFRKAPDPTIKEGEFNFSVTYELDGEQKTISSVYVCEFEESGMLMDGWYITWNAYVEDSEIEALFHDESYNGGILIGTNEYGKVYLDLSLDAGYLMAEPGSGHREYNPSIFIQYNEEMAEKLNTYGESDPAILESYGVKLISYECDAPIENTYK
ncbi:MAG: hypothetical protein J6S04_00475 [Clostridia bacterium]|nr:hypothetical protein [Clostridia bacterium]